MLFCQVSFVQSTVSCDHGLKACEYYPWAAWGSCNSTCNGIRYRLKPICCEQPDDQHRNFSECLKACNVSNDSYMKSKFQQEKCGHCSKYKQMLQVFQNILGILKRCSLYILIQMCVVASCWIGCFSILFSWRKIVCISTRKFHLYIL